MTQLALFGPDPGVSVPIHRAVPTEARPRLGRQQAAILARLQQGPAANTELITIAQRFGGRIYELRQARYRIETFREDHASGVVWYRLK